MSIIFNHLLNAFTLSYVATGAIQPGGEHGHYLDHVVRQVFLEGRALRLHNIRARHTETGPQNRQKANEFLTTTPTLNTAQRLAFKLIGKTYINR